MRKGIVFLRAFLVLLSVSVAAHADVFQLSLSDYGFYGASRTRVFGADLTTIAGLGQIRSVQITDDGTNPAAVDRYRNYRTGRVWPQKAQDLSFNPVRTNGAEPTQLLTESVDNEVGGLNYRHVSESFPSEPQAF